LPHKFQTKAPWRILHQGYNNEEVNMPLQIEQTFDDKTYRHYTNDFLSVMHCHHYLTLATKLAEQFADIGGQRILAESAEDAVRPMLDDYIKKHAIADPAERLRVGQEYYAVMGMGKMEAQGDQGGGSVTLRKSHLDQGWIMKWGNRDTPMNYWTRGYINAMFGAAFDKPPHSYEVAETTAMVTGAAESQYQVKAK
jgi:hypothetical protein